MAWYGEKCKLDQIKSANSKAHFHIIALNVSVIYTTPAAARVGLGGGKKWAIKLCLPPTLKNPKPCKCCQMGHASIFQLNTTYIK